MSESIGSSATRHYHCKLCCHAFPNLKGARRCCDATNWRRCHADCLPMTVLRKSNDDDGDDDGDDS